MNIVNWFINFKCRHHFSWYFMNSTIKNDCNNFCWTSKRLVLITELLLIMVEFGIGRLIWEKIIKINSDLYRSWNNNTRKKLMVSVSMKRVYEFFKKNNTYVVFYVIMILQTHGMLSIEKNHKYVHMMYVYVVVCIRPKL